MKNFKIVTYGCQMNVHESEKLAGILQARGLQSTEETLLADIILFNTCCIREGAEDRALGNIGALKALKANKPSLIIGVCGCMPQQQNAAERIIKKFPFIDLIFGTHNLHMLSQLLDTRLSQKKPVLQVWDNEDGIFEDVPMQRTSGYNAWVNIMYGCNNYCTYCIVPYVRGRERSRSIEDIKAEVKLLISLGYPEITLLGQNVNSYGSDLSSGVCFANLLEILSSVDGNFRLKFMTSHPKDLSEDVVRVIAQSPKLANFIHLPMQSGSDRILKAMNRHYTQKDYLNKIDMIRKYIPDCGLSSDFMVGFPGETEEDFAQTLHVIKAIRYDNLYSFIYSRRKGTAADRMDEHIDLKSKRDRIQRLIALQGEIASTVAHNLIGYKMRVLALEHKNDILSAQSDNGRAISVPGTVERLGTFFDVTITKSRKSRLYGEAVQ